MCETKKRNHRLHNIPAGTFDDNETLETVKPKNQWKRKKTHDKSRHAKAFFCNSHLFPEAYLFVLIPSDHPSFAIVTGGASQRFP